jgi:hypothetical protein
LLAGIIPEIEKDMRAIKEEIDKNNRSKCSLPRFSSIWS